MLISGGGAGIGAAMVDAFARQGARVYFLDRDAASARAMADSVRNRHGVAVAYEVCDLTDVPSSLAAVGRLENAAGAFRALVNNAGNDTRPTGSDR